MTDQADLLQSQAVDRVHECVEHLRIAPPTPDGEEVGYEDTAALREKSDQPAVHLWAHREAVEEYDGRPVAGPYGNLELAHGAPKVTGPDRGKARSVASEGNCDVAHSGHCDICPFWALRYCPFQM